MAGKIELRIILPEKKFISFCSETIIHNKQTVEKSLCEGIKHTIQESLKGTDFLLNVSYRHSFELYDLCLSLKEYIDNGFISIHYFEVILGCRVIKPSLDLLLVFPDYISPGGLGLVYPHDFEANHRLPLYAKKALKTKPEYIFKASETRINEDVLLKIYQSLPDNFDVLMPSKLGVWEWRQTFYNIKTGGKFVCGCFKKAILLEDKRQRKHTADGISFKDGICHLCTGIPSDLFYCHEMYGSPVKVKYGAYIKKTMIEKHIPEHKAENIIRAKIGVPLIGEGWISETQLFKRIQSDFPNIEVIHHGRPSFLKKQEYDIWIPKYKVAVEYQGEQHKKPIGYLGGETALAVQKQRDERKRILSAENGVSLFCVEKGYDYDDLLRKIKSVIRKSSA